MSKTLKILALIPPAVVPKDPAQNVKPIGGKPLIAWAIEAALCSRVLDAVVVSTEDEETPKWLAGGGAGSFPAAS